MERLTRAWNERNRAVFLDSCENVARYVAETALDRDKADAAAGRDESERGTLGLLKDALKFSAVDKRRSMDALSKRLDGRTADLMDRLIAGHGLFGDSAATIERRVQDFQVQGIVPFDERSGASRRKPLVTWTPGFLYRLCHQAMLRYLAVAHFGRGRGGYRDLEQPAHWSGAVDRVLGERRTVLDEIWSDAEKPDAQGDESLTARLRTVVEAGLREVLREAYPDAGGL
jgi:hypothetical protein